MSEQCLGLEVMHAQLSTFPKVFVEVILAAPDSIH